MNSRHFFIIILISLAAASGCRPSGSESPAAATEIKSVASVPSPAILVSPSPSPTARPTAVRPTAAPTPTPTLPPSPIPTPTPWPTSSPAALPWSVRQTLGYSVREQAIEVLRMGNGPDWWVIMGAIHGGHECNTGALVWEMINHFMAEPTLLPSNITLYAIPVINPDGCSSGTRFNANQVDLNRNWDTFNWVSDAAGPGGIISGSGGPSPFSEPETRLIRDWLTNLSNQHLVEPIRVISYHSVVPNTGLVQPGYSQPGQPNPLAVALAQTYADATGYLYSDVWVGNYTITGEFIHWANDHGLIAIDVELPDRNAATTVPAGWSETHIQTNLQSLLAVAGDMGTNPEQ